MLSLNLKASIICLVVLAAAIVSSKADNIPDSKFMKMKITKPWNEVTITFIVAGYSGLPVVKSKTEEIRAKRAVYEFGSESSADRKEYSMLCIHDLDTGKYAFIDAEHSFYTSAKSRVTGYSVGPGVLVWTSSYAEFPDTNQIDYFISQFEKSFDRQTLYQEEGKRLNINRIDLNQAAPRWYFSMSPAPGSGIVIPEVKSVELTDDILKLSLANPATKMPAEFWVNLKEKKVVKSVVNGQEMNLNTGKAFAIPLNSK
jgi:hypothetical protein